MSTRGKKERRVFFSATVRLVILTLGLFLQMALAAVLAYFLQRLSVVIMVLLYLVSFAVFIYVSVHHDNPSTRPFWLLLIALFPGFGLLLYFMWGLPRHGMKRHAIQFASQKDASDSLMAYSGEIDDAAGRCDISLSLMYPTLWNASRYLRSYGFPLCGNTKITYFPSGEAFFTDCLDVMKSAQKSIFLSFFILRDGRLWQQFYEILRAKALLGVEIRLLIDDAGTMFNISPEYIKELQQNGIQVDLFNPTHRYLNNLYLNYRNHQKMVIIDSDIAYTGGVNLADEYANYTSPFGYWKDTGVRLDGQGVFGLTTTFINMWDQTKHRLSKSYMSYRPQHLVQEEGYCQVFSDGPSNNPKNPAEGLIFHMIESAQKYVYLTTPYLAVSQALIDTLCRVALSGVRVVLLVPYQLDHWYVFEVTQSFFPALIDAGVEIYRFSPGMLHAKMVVADDIHALVGTINLDNRSFYSQYEDGVWFCGKQAVTEVKNDIEHSVSQSYRVTKEDMNKIGLIRASLGYILRLFSPLM
jgi:cardiolipin synthase